MNTALHTFAVAIVSVASAAAIGIGLADTTTAAPAGEVVKLERVVVVGQHDAPVAVVAKLPRVVISQRRAASPEAVVAQAQAPVWIA